MNITRRRAWLAVLGLFLGFPARVAEARDGVLTIDLGQWEAIHVTHRGRLCVASPAQIFAALEGSC